MIWDAPKLVYWADDGEGHYFIKVQLEDGRMLAWPVDVNRASALVTAGARALVELAKQQRPPN